MSRYDDDERSYEAYRRYQINKHRYEMEQKTPFFVILIVAVIVAYWKQILIASLICAGGMFAFFLYLRYGKRKMKSNQPLVLTPQEAKNGAEITCTVDNLEPPITFQLSVLPNTKNGEKLAVRNVVARNKQGRKIKMDIWFDIEIK